MKYKKILLGSALLASLGMINTANAAEITIADSITVNFTGVFQDTTCDINIDGNEVSDAKSVDLGAHKTTEIAKDGDTTQGVDFTANFSGCGALRTASVTFTGTQTTGNLFDVTGSNAGAVGIQPLYL